MTVTYVAASACTILPKRPRADMVVTYTDDGLEMTITWAVPSGERGDSTYIGAEAWTYGATDSEEAVSQIWDRLHINKVSGDIKTIGVGTSYPILQSGIQRSDVNAGDTIVINDGTYSNYYDVLNIGYWQDGSQGATNTQTPNGISDGVDTVNVIGSDGVTVVGTEDIVSISKFTTIMSATPLGAILDRDDYYHSSRVRGNYRGGQGFRITHGIKIKGVAVRSSLQALSMEHVDSCAFEFCSSVSDTNPEDFESKYGETWPRYQGDGGQFNTTATRNCYIDACSSIGNDRFGLIVGAGYPYLDSPSKHTTYRRMLHTLACLQPYEQNIAQDYTIYGGRSVELLNCIAVDSALFESGYRNAYTLGVNLATNEHSSFIATNESGDDLYMEGLVSLSSTTIGYRSKTTANSIGSEMRNSVFWDKKGELNNLSMLIGTDIDISGITVGKNENSSRFGSCISDYGSAVYDDTLMLSGAWDYQYSSTDNSIITAGFSGITGDNNLGVIPASATNAEYMASVTDVTLIEAENAISSGAHYIGYTSPGSTLRDNGIGCPDVFATIGTGGNLKLDGDLKRYDGLGADQMVNWLAEVPWIEFRRERQAYSCLANGQQFTGNVGISKAGINPTDYLNRFGTTPLNPLNAPMISDIYGKALGSGAVTLWWRPVCPAYRSTITGYHVYVDGIKVTPNGTALPKASTSIPLTSINTGTRTFQVVVVDPTNGNSGLSRPVILTVT